MKLDKVLTLVSALALVVMSAPSGWCGSTTTITLLHPHPGAYKVVLAEFAKVHPEIKVEEQSIPFRTGTWYRRGDE
jgi:ABC-type glycerol-3-phosphate transport system substrate-binding protein